MRKTIGCACKASKEIVKIKTIRFYDCVCDSPYIKGELIKLKELVVVRK